MMHTNWVKLTVGCDGGGMAAFVASAFRWRRRRRRNKRVRILFADFSERMGLFFVAKEMRFFEEQGLDAQIVQVRNAPVAVVVGDGRQ